MARGILVIGSLNMDLVVKSPRIPRAGETIIGGGFKTVPGGKGANQAVACARLGARTFMVGRVGRDGFGTALVSNLKGAGVHTERVLRDEREPSGIALIIVDAKGQNSIVVASGANARVSPRDVEKLGGLWSAVGFLIMQLEIPIETVDCALGLARRKGVVTILDAGPARPLPTRLLKKIDILSPNEHETRTILGAAGMDEESAAKELLDLGAKTVVLKLGAAGCLVARPGETTRLPAFRIKAVDTTAAGDAFTAALAVALSEGQSLVGAARTANAAGALACTKFGAQPSMPTRNALNRFLRDSATGLGC
jgi:ribokinase